MLRPALKTLPRVRESERKAVVGTFLVLFGMMAGHTLLETARDALFLAGLPATHLPWLYLAIAALALPASQLGARRASRLSLSVWLWVSAAVSFAFWIVSGSAGAWILYALYIWTGVCVSVAMVQFWLTLSRFFTLDQAKRLYGLIGAGSVLGAVTGAGVAAGLTALVPTRHLLLAAALCFAASGAGPALMGRRKTRAVGVAARPGEVSLLSSIRAVFEQPYLARLAGLMVVATIAFTLVDYVFKVEVDARIAPDQLGTFFALFYAALNVVALTVQVLLTGWLLRLLGVQRTLWILPLLLFVAAFSVILGGGLLAAAALRSADGSLKHSLHQTASEVLFLPISNRLRPNAKRFIDMVGRRSAQALTSLVILAVVAAGGDVAWLAGLVCAVAVVWLFAARDLRPHYLNLFRESLRKGRIDSRVAVPKLDLAGLESLVAALDSSDDAEVLTALDLLANSGRGHLVPVLILHHRCPAVIQRALALFEWLERRDFLSGTAHLLDHPDPEVRAAILRLRSDEPELVDAARRDPHPLVRATAVVAPGRASEAAADVTRERLDAMLRDGDPTVTRGVARAVAEQPHPTFLPVIDRLARSADPEVRAAAADALGKLRSPGSVPRLVELLGHREVRPHARRALKAIGEAALPELGAVLGDPSRPFVLRRHVPRAVSDIGGEPAAKLLTDRLPDEASGMIRYRILRALTRMRAEEPLLALDEVVLRKAVERTLRAAFTLLDWRLVLERGAAADARRQTPGYELVTSLLAAKEVNAVERLALLVSLMFPEEDFRELARGLRGQRRQAAVSSVEILDNLLSPPLRDPIVGLLGGVVHAIPDSERLERAGPFHQACQLSYDELLRDIHRHGSSSLEAVVRYHAEELGLAGFPPVDEGHHAA